MEEKTQGKDINYLAIALNKLPPTEREVRGIYHLYIYLKKKIVMAFFEIPSLTFCVQADLLPDVGIHVGDLLAAHDAAEDDDTSVKPEKVIMNIFHGTDFSGSVTFPSLPSPPPIQILTIVSWA